VKSRLPHSAVSIGFSKLVVTGLLWTMFGRLAEISHAVHYIIVAIKYS